MKVVACLLVLCVVAAFGAEFRPSDDAIRAKFALLDTNKNGQLTRDEIIDYLVNGDHPGYVYDAVKAGEQLDKIFAADKDNSGSLSVDEVIKYVNSDGYKFLGIAA